PPIDCRSRCSRSEHSCRVFNGRPAYEKSTCRTELKERANNMAVKDALDLVKKNKVEIVDFKFVDVPGLWQYFSIPAAELTGDLVEQGIGFDGSSIRGFQSINESVMLLIPDPDTAMMDPFTEHPT